MTIKELKRIFATAKDTDRIELINGEITYIKYEPQDITERIQCLEDARQWCNSNGKSELVCDLDLVSDCFDGLNDENKRDILAYLKLRIITCALNEGWVPTEQDSLFVPVFLDYGLIDVIGTSVSYYNGNSSASLCFKNRELAEYGATQFAEIYAGFCGVKKGGEV